MSETLSGEVEVPCSPREAWGHVTDPSWLGDDGEIDLIPGGEGWVREADETYYVVVEEVDEDRHFSYRWSSFTDEPTLVEIDLSPSDVGTRITISESPLEAKASAALVAA